MIEARGADELRRDADVVDARQNGTPMTLIVVVSTTMISPRMTAFAAKSVLK